MLCVAAWVAAARFASEVVITGGAFAYSTLMYGKVRRAQGIGSADGMHADCSRAARGVVHMYPSRHS
jgi:hypothetical protein